MKKVINVTGIPSRNIINGMKGSFRSVVKCRAGFFTIVDEKRTNPVEIFNGYKKGALHSIEFIPEGSDFGLTIFAKKGKKIMIIDESILRELKVGDINSNWFNTELYNQNQYNVVGAKTWADNAFVKN